MSKTLRMTAPITKKKGQIYSRKCYECQRQMIGERQNYRYTECGLNSVILKDVIVYHCECGSIVPEIPSVQSLHILIALDILTKDSLLSPQEIRFVRSIVGYSATKLADVMGVGRTVISRWENNKAKIGKESDRLLRFACFFAIRESMENGEEETTQEMVRLLKEIKGLKLSTVLQRIKDTREGSKQVFINPDQLMGSSPSGFVQ